MLKKRYMNKELFLNYYIAKRDVSIIEDILGSPILEAQLETYVYGKKIDILCYTKDSTVFIETQLLKSDKVHLKSLKQLISSIEGGSKIIWIASSFSGDMIQQILEHIEQAKKDIDFYAVTFNSEILCTLEELRSVHVLKEEEKLSALDSIDGKLELFYRFINPNRKEVRRSGKREISDKEYINKLIIDEMRKKSKYITLYKERNLCGNIISIGGGRDGINYELTYLNQDNEAYVGCKFSFKNKDIFLEIYKNKELLRGQIKEDIIFDTEYRTIRIYYLGEEIRENKIEWLTNTMVRLMSHLINHTCYFGFYNYKEMFKQHKEGIMVT